MNATPLSLIPNSELDNWYRVGGHELQFFATNDEVQNWLIGALLPDFAQYCLVGADLVKKGKYYIQRPFHGEISDLQRLMDDVPDRWAFFIMSEILSPGLVLSEGEDIEGLCSFNALISLQHGMTIEHRVPRSRISIVNRLRWKKDMNIERADEQYNKICKHLRQIIAKEAVYSTIITFSDGQEREDTFARMTEGAVKAYHNEFPFSRRPGTKIEKKKCPREKK